MNSYFELGDILNPDVISDSSHNNSNSVLTARQLHLTDLIVKEAKSAFSNHIPALPTRVIYL